MDDPTRDRSLRSLYLFCFTLGLLPLLWPADTPWINDEPLFIQQALEAAARGELASHGLVGTKGLAYGPFAVWVYTALLTLSHDLVVLVFLRALLCTAVTAVAICWMARLGRRLRPALGALALLSPYLWLYSRQLWDNTFLIPLSAIALCAYVSFCLRQEPWRLWLTTVCLTCMFLLHLMSLALIVPLVVHALLSHHRWLRAHLGTALGQVAIAVILCIPYLLQLASSLGSVSQKAAQALAGTAAAPPAPLFRIEGWIFPLLGGRLLSAQGIEYFFTPQWGPGWLRAVALGTWVALALVWVGIGLSLRDVLRARAGLAERDGDHHLGVLCLSILLAQVVLNGVMQTFGHPHYYNATWACFLYFLWRALSALPSAVGVAYGAVLAGVLGFLVVDIHRSGGNRDIHYGTTLGHQIEIARRLHAYAPGSRVTSTMENYVLFPHALTVLRGIYHLEGTPGAPRRRLLIRPLSPAGRDGWLTVEASREAPGPEGSDQGN